MKKAVSLKDMIFHTSGGRGMVSPEKEVTVPVNNGISEVGVVKFLT